MKKNELITAIAEQTQLSKKDAEAAIKAFVDVVSEELKEKVIDLLNFYCRPVKIRRFTKFVLSEAESPGR